MISMPWELFYMHKIIHQISLQMKMPYGKFNICKLCHFASFDIYDKEINEIGFFSKTLQEKDRSKLS